MTALRKTREGTLNTLLALATVLCLAPAWLSPEPTATVVDAVEVGAFAANIEQAQQLFEDEAYDEAVAMLQILVETNPQNGPLFYLLGSALYEAGDSPGAARALQRATRLGVAGADALLLLGSAQQDMNDRVGARQSYEGFLSQMPTGETADEVRRILEQL
jgi:cytochrome c-type biogenesis protein CcmH/NrfG